jgi:hypothetical protein
VRSITPRGPSWLQWEAWSTHHARYGSCAKNGVEDKKFIPSETHTASHSHTTHISCSSSTCDTHSTHTPRAWPAQQHIQRSRTEPTRSHARNHLVIAHTVGGPDRSCIRGEKKKC